MIEKVNKDDFIINKRAGDMAVIDKIDKKGYIHFKYYYGKMFDKLKNTDNYTLQENYLKFWDFCNDDEKNNMVKIINNEKAFRD